MSISRIFLVCSQAVLYQLASTPPNPTPQKARYDTSHAWYIKLAAPIMIAQRPFIWLCTFADIFLILIHSRLSVLPQSFSDRVEGLLCSNYARGTVSATSSLPNIRTTSISLFGLALIVFGTTLRLICYRALGSLFTFNLTILPAHKLITSGPYAYVRHPAYTGTLAVCIGLALVNLFPGGWVAECEILGRGTESVVFRTIGTVCWWGWWLIVGFSRCRSEDAELSRKFGDEWERYAESVQAWFIPGLL